MWTSQNAGQKTTSDSCYSPGSWAEVTQGNSMAVTNPNQKPKPRKQAREARRAVVARGVVLQKSTTQIGEQLGISRMQVWREVQKPETQALIRSWMQDYHDEIRAEIPNAIAAVRDKLKPDSDERLQAVKTLGTVMEWAEGRADDGDSRPKRWEGEFVQLLEFYQSFEEPATGAQLD